MSTGPSCWSPHSHPWIDYDKASAIAHQANDEDTTLREAALASGYISAEDIDRIVRPATMVGKE
ncbi:hypothetical protein GCM10027073_44090 [Streptomyces chlorus]|uniref:Fumarase C C-terminal domain-containing protein n=1 Tax=Streptomyces chlorus TaxID=887452 RepID=A0ABW1DZZ6_9ACTN